MNKLALVLLLPLVSCGQGEEGPRPGKDGFSLVGTWLIDVERTHAEIDKSPLPERERESAKRFYAGEQMTALELDFGEGGETEIRNRPGADGPVRGTWRVTAKDGSRWTLQMQESGAPAPETSEVTWLDEDHISVVETGKTDSVVLRRK